MNTRHCLKIAIRIDALLVRELGQGMDANRMVAEPRYARDVLLVCDAMRDTDAPELAGHYRRATLAAEENAAASRKGFSASRFLSSLFGRSSGFGHAAVPPRTTATEVRDPAR